MIRQYTESWTRPPQNPGPKTRTSFLMCVCGNKTYSFGPFSYQLYGFSCVRFTGYALCLHSLTHTWKNASSLKKRTVFSQTVETIHNGRFMIVQHTWQKTSYRIDNLLVNYYLKAMVWHDGNHRSCYREAGCVHAGRASGPFQGHHCWKHRQPSAITQQQLNQLPYQQPAGRLTSTTRFLTYEHSQTVVAK